MIANADSEDEREPSQTEILMTLAEDADLFHDANGVAYAEIEVKGHRETWDIRAEGFAHWIGRRFFQETKNALIPDTLCRLSTGGSHVAREIFTNQKELTFSATRPMILNGIEEFVNRSDLADRPLFLTLESIPEDKRRAEAEFWKSFEAERPYILRALFDGMVEGLRNVNEIHLPKLPRLADFALWASACEAAYWKSGTFISPSTPTEKM